MAEDLSGLDESEINLRLAEVAERLKPLERELAAARAQRDVILTELRRRERRAQMESRAGVKAAMKAGAVPNLAELVSAGEQGPFDDFVYNLKTGGEVRLGFPGARAQSLSFTDGKQVAQARDLAEAGRFFEAGWELGSPGRPGVRVHFPGTRQERLAEASEVFARRR